MADATDSKELPGALEAAAAEGAAHLGAGGEVATLLRLGGRKADLASRLLASGDAAKAAEDLRAAADYLEVAANLSCGEMRAAA